MTPIEAYIRSAAIARGIDPDVAVRVAMSEGGVEDPALQSRVPTKGGKEQSYGPFQLYFGGGLGNDALAAGVDARDPNQWQQAVDFALNHAAKEGWGAFHGAANTGIGKFQGIGDNARTMGISLNTTPAGLSAGTPVAATPSAPDTGGAPPASSPAGPTSVPQTFANFLQSDAGKGLLGAIGGGSREERPAASADIAPSSIGAEIGSGAGAVAAAQLMAALLSSRRARHGISLSGGPFGV